jgi:NUMOD3 motif-containing protein
MNQELIYCACGCKQTLQKFNKWGYERKYIHGHHQTGKKYTEEHRKKLSEKKKGIIFSKEHIRKLSIAQRGEKSHIWKGDNVGNRALHDWINRNFPKHDLCQMCNIKPPYDCANITGIYNREFKNWARFCRKCHMLFDNTMQRNLKPFRNGNETRIIPSKTSYSV